MEDTKRKGCSLESWHGHCYCVLHLTKTKKEKKEYYKSILRFQRSTKETKFDIADLLVFTV